MNKQEFKKLEEAFSAGQLLYETSTGLFTVLESFSKTRNSESQRIKDLAELREKIIKNYQNIENVVFKEFETRKKLLSDLEREYLFWRGHDLTVALQSLQTYNKLLNTINLNPHKI